LRGKVENGLLVYEAATEHEVKLTEGREVFETEEQVVPSALSRAVRAWI